MHLPGFRLPGASCRRTEPRCGAFPRERPRARSLPGCFWVGAPASSQAVGAGSSGWGSFRAGREEAADGRGAFCSAAHEGGVWAAPLLLGLAGGGPPPRSFTRRDGRLASLWHSRSLPPSPPPRLTCGSHSPVWEEATPPAPSLLAWELYHLPLGRRAWALGEQEIHPFWSVRGALSLGWAGDGGS